MNLNLTQLQFNDEYSVFISEGILGKKDAGRKELIKTVVRSIFGEKTKVLFTDEKKSVAFSSPAPTPQGVNRPEQVTPASKPTKRAGGLAANFDPKEVRFGS